MSKKLPKEEQHYQLSKPYGFRDLELSLIVKRDECETLKKEVKRLTEENAGLRYDIKKLEDKEKIERLANPTCAADYGISITYGSKEEAEDLFRRISEAKADE